MNKTILFCILFLIKGYCSDLTIQICCIAESVRLQQMLANYGIQSQTPHQIEPIEIWPPSELVKAYESLGLNQKLKLTGYIFLLPLFINSYLVKCSFDLDVPIDQ